MSTPPVKNNIKAFTALVKEYWENITPEELEKVLKDHRNSFLEYNKRMEALDKPPTTELLNRTYNI